MKPEGEGLLPQAWNLGDCFNSVVRTARFEFAGSLKALLYILKPRSESEMIACLSTWTIIIILK